MSVFSDVRYMDLGDDRSKKRSPRSCEWGITACEWRIMTTPRLARTESPKVQSHRPSKYIHTNQYSRQNFTISHDNNTTCLGRRRLNRQSGVRHGKIRPQRTVHAVHATDDQASEAAIRAAYGRRITSFIIQRRLFIACRTGIQPHHPKSTACATSRWPHPP